jgi:hypothetical protein
VCTVERGIFNIDHLINIDPQRQRLTCFSPSTYLLIDWRGCCLFRLGALSGETACSVQGSARGAVSASMIRRQPPPPLSFVLIGHAASFTPY